MKKVDALQMSILNKREVIHLIRKRGLISRAEISALTGLTAPTVTRIVNHLVHEEKLVSFTGIGESQGGRPPLILEFNGKNNYIIGIDLGATRIRGVLSDLEANLIIEIQIPTEIRKGFEIIMDQVAELVNKLLDRRNLDKERVKGIGIGIAGLVNKKTGIVDFSPDFGWKNVNVRESLKQRLDLPFIFDNSTRLMALGELEFGEGRKYDNFVVINVGYGIAAGIVVDGSTLKGASGHAGEFGHMIVQPNSEIQCECGAKGCLEALASGRRIAQMGQNIAAANKNSLLIELCKDNLSDIDAKMVAKAASMGDKDSIEIYRKVTSYLGIGVANLANLLDPQIIFVGGGVSLNGDLFFHNLQKAVKDSLITPEKSIKTIPSSFGENATIMGALALITRKILNFEPISPVNL